MKPKKYEPPWMQMYREQVLKPKQRQRETEQKGRTASSRTGKYNTGKWKRLRAAFIKANPLCRMCEEKGIDRAATLVDHIKPEEDYPELFYEWDNLQSLCNYHHIHKTNTDKHDRNQRRKLEQGRKLMNDLEKGEED